MAVCTENRLIVAVRRNIIDHFYIRALNVWQLEDRERKGKRGARVVNMYDNYLTTNHAWSMLGSGERR